MSMTYESEFDTLLNHLKTSLNLPSLEKKDPNICSFFYQEIPISLINQSGNLIINSVFANLYDYESQDKIKKFLLEANVLYIGSLGGSFAVNSSNGISYCYQYPIQHLSNEKFLVILVTYIKSIQEFKTRFEEIENTYLSTATVLNTQQNQQEHWQKI